MLYSGLVSVSFRDLNYQEIIDLVKEAGLLGIEWGGDVHVPHGDINKAQKVKEDTKKAGLKTAAYGSYYRVGCEQGNIDCEFKEVLDTALALEAPLIRVWAGDRGSDKADENWWQQVIEESREIAEMASSENIKIAFEYHNNTLTDTLDTTLRLLKEINHPNIYSYWQPPRNITVAEGREQLEELLPWLENLHVHYLVDNERLALKEGKDNWKEYFASIAGEEKERYALIEFVKDNEPEQFLEDGAVLKKLIEGN